jgi:glutaryl-CoA dehydrogenase
VPDGDFYDYTGLLEEEEKQIVERVRAFMAEEIAPIADEAWTKASFPHQIVPKMAKLDVTELEYRGGRSLLTGFVVLEMNRVDPSIGTFFGVHSGLAMGSIARLGSREQRQRWLPPMATMEKIGAFALTEPDGGSDVAAGLRTTARREGDVWVLDGAKRWIGNGTFADVVVVWAKDVADGQVKGFVVEKGTPGFTATKIENKIALRTVQNADITLTGCRVPEANRLSYAGEREQFGRPIAAFQLVQDLLVRMLGNLTSSFGMVVRLAQLQDAGVYRDEHSAMAKAYCTARMREAVGWGREIMAGNGIVLEYGMGRFVADSEAIYSYEGTREINSLIVGRAITGHGAFV